MKNIIKILPLVIIIFFGFTEQANLVTGNWYQQFMPNIGNRQISDIIFIDSLNGFAVTNNISQNDTGYILKTINSGDNWSIKFIDLRYFTKAKFINSNTGFVTGGAGNGAKIYKTTDAGNNWLSQNIPGGGHLTFEDINALNEDTIWIVDSDGLLGGVFRTINGGTSWQQQLNLNNENPKKIYMYNRNIGFVSTASGSQLYRTTNSGLNWAPVTGENGFIQMFFVDSLQGWKTKGDTMKVSSNGGLNWTRQILPFGGMISSANMTSFAVLNRDTLWGCGGYVHYPNNQFREILYRTTNGGQNWLFQVPDTSIVISYNYINFADKLHGWAYSINPTGIHTITGGDPVWITGVRQISSQVPGDFKLFQNYPNPFNPSTNIKYQITASPGPSEGGEHEVRLIVYDITGREIIKLVNQQQNAGTYEVDFSGSNLSSGVYFYTLLIDNKLIDTQKMVLIK